MPWLSWVGYIAGAVVGIHWGRRARANLSPEGQVLGAKRTWATREYFTERGWSYQQRAVWGSLGIWLLTWVLTRIRT
jgi:hypothetical protein